jgi:hypothetical protein
VRHRASTVSLHNSKKEHQLARKLHVNCTPTCIVRIADISVLFDDRLTAFLSLNFFDSDQIHHNFNRVSLEVSLKLSLKLNLCDSAR